MRKATTSTASLFSYSYKRNAGGEHCGERARKTRNRRFSDDLSDDRHTQQHTIHQVLHFEVALVAEREQGDGADNATEDRPPPFGKGGGQVHHELRQRRKVGAETPEQGRELRNHEDHQDCGDDEGHDEHRDRVKERRLDLALDRLDLFLVGGKPVQDGIEDTGLLTGGDEVAVELIEV